MPRRVRDRDVILFHLAPEEFNLVGRAPGQPGPVRRGRAQRLRAGQLALGAPLSPAHNRTATSTTALSDTHTAPPVSHITVGEDNSE